MKWPLLAVVLISAGTVLAADEVAPATRPAASPGKVLILPLAKDSPDQGGDRSAEWIARAVQQSLVSDVVRQTAAQPVTGPAALDLAAADADAALRLAKAAGARLVLFGSYQFIEPDLRITAQVLNVETGESVGALKATGSLRDLFVMEDSLGSQLARILAPGTRPEPAEQNTAVAVRPEGPVRMGGEFNGSGLQRAMYEPQPMSGAYAAPYERYQYNYPLAYPYDGYYGGYSYWGYPYFGLAYPYYPFYGRGYTKIIINNGATPAPVGSNPAATVSSHTTVTPMAPRTGMIGVSPRMPSRPAAPPGKFPITPTPVGGRTR